MALNRALRRRP